MIKKHVEKRSGEGDVDSTNTAGGRWKRQHRQDLSQVKSRGDENLEYFRRCPT